MKEIVIKISDEVYKYLEKRIKFGMATEMDKIVWNGKVLPKGHGRLIDIDKVVENEETFRKYFNVTTHPLMNGKLINCIAPSVVEADKGEE